MTVKTRQAAALAAFEIDRVSEGLSALTPPSDILSSRATAKLVAYVERIAQVVGDLQADLESARDSLVSEGVAAPGLSVNTASVLLDVSEPTIREWMRRGALDQVEDSKPALVTLESVASAKRALDEIRERGANDPEWASSLFDAVESAAVFGSPSVKAGLEQLKRGQLEPA